MLFSNSYKLRSSSSRSDPFSISGDSPIFVGSTNRRHRQHICPCLRMDEEINHNINDHPLIEFLEPTWLPPESKAPLEWTFPRCCSLAPTDPAGTDCLGLRAEKNGLITRFIANNSISSLTNCNQLFFQLRDTLLFGQPLLPCHLQFVAQLLQLIVPFPQNIVVFATAARHGSGTIWALEAISNVSWIVDHLQREKARGLASSSFLITWPLHCTTLTAPSAASDCDLFPGPFLPTAGRNCPRSDFLSPFVSVSCLFSCTSRSFLRRSITIIWFSSSICLVSSSQRLSRLSIVLHSLVAE